MVTICTLAEVELETLSSVPVSCFKFMLANHDKPTQNNRKINQTLFINPYL